MPLGKTTIECQTVRKTSEEGKLHKLSFNGYNGGPVKLYDYGFDLPVVYNIATINLFENTPLLYKHDIEIGHVTKLDKSESSVDGEAVLSVPNSRSREVAEASNNSFPYQGSMGLEPRDDTIATYIAEDQSVVVNGRKFEGPLYVLENLDLVEFTVTVTGRDRTTSVVKLSKEELMTIKNSAPKGETKPITNQTDPPQKNEGGQTEQPKKTETKPQETVENTTPTEPIKNEAPKKKRRRVENSPSQDYVPRTMLANVVKWTRDYGDHMDLVEKAIENNWDGERLNNEVRLARLDNDLPQLPGPRLTNQDRPAQLLNARVSATFGVSPETIKSKFNNEIAKAVEEMPHMSLKEMLVNSANMMGGRFTGLNIDNMEQCCKFLKNAYYGRFHNEQQYSTVHFNTLLQQAAQLTLEERWKIDPPWAPSKLFEVSKSNFLEEGRVRPSGGEMWEHLDNQGRIKHTSMGDETIYKTHLNTVAQMLILDRETIINDSLGMVQEMFNMMLEGAMMVPDYLFGKKLLDNQTNSFWTTSGDDQNMFFGAGNALSKTALSTVYKKVRRIAIQKGKLSWNSIANTEWALVVGPDLEEDAWEILRQERLITGENATKGSRNYWFQRLDLWVWPNMDNTGLFANADSANWMLMPKRALYAPFSISYLGNRKRPVTEEVDLPANMLGAGVRGYWDVEVDFREPETVALVLPNQASAQTMEQGIQARKAALAKQDK